MPTFDPTKPATSSLISSRELRDQLNALNDQITTMSGQLSDLPSDVLPRMTAAGSLPPLTAAFSNPCLGPPTAGRLRCSSAPECKSHRSPGPR
jgi:hypothetical protein